MLSRDIISDIMISTFDRDGPPYADAGRDNSNSKPKLSDILYHLTYINVTGDTSWSPKLLRPI